MEFVKMRNELIEFGEISRKPIGKRTLLNHWILINNAMFADKHYNFIYWKGGFYYLNDYTVKQINNNEYASKIKLVRYL